MSRPNQKWYAVQFGPYHHMQDQPFYDAKDMLNSDDVGEEAAARNAKIAEHAPEMLQQLKDIVAAWEKLPEGNYTPDQIQKWLVEVIHPQINSTRELIKSATEL